LVRAEQANERPVDENCGFCYQTVRGIYANFARAGKDATNLAEMVDDICERFPPRLRHLKGFCDTHLLPAKDRIAGFYRAKTVVPVACGLLGLCPLHNPAAKP